MPTSTFTCELCSLSVTKYYRPSSLRHFCSRKCFQLWAKLHPECLEPHKRATGPRPNAAHPTKLSADLNRKLVLEFLEHRLNTRQIAAKYGVEKTSVVNAVNAAGFTGKDGTWVSFQCETCGKNSSAPRWRWRKHKHHYCSPGCYSEGQKLRHTGIVARKNPFCGVIIVPTYSRH